MNFKHLLLVLASSLTLGTSALYAHGPNTHLEEQFLREEFVREHLPLARQQLYLYRIPISITLGQCGLESAYGASELATEANNFFGIKAQLNWVGKRYTKSTQEEENGVVKFVDAEFRQYANAEESYNDRSIFLISAQRYAHLFELATTDYRGWAHGLKKAGYATKADYAEILINVIETNKFHQYDELVTKAAIAFNNLDKTSSQLTMMQVSTPNPNSKQQAILSSNEMLMRIERISDASLLEQQNLKIEINGLQTQINDVKRGVNSDRYTQKEEISELYRRVDELTIIVQQQSQYIKNLEDCLRELELQQQVIFNADPLRNQFTITGQPRQQLEIFPITQNSNNNIFHVSGKKTVNLLATQTLFDVANQHNILYRDLLIYNDLTAETAENLQKLYPNIYIFLEPKATSTSNTELVHTVRAGETMHSISQLYGVKLSKIAQRNHISIEKGEEPAVGQPIYINIKATEKPKIVPPTDASVPFGSGGVSAPKK